MNHIIRQYNYRLETGTVGTDDENIANILYTINQMEAKASFSSSDCEELEEALGQLLFMILDAKVHMNRFLKAEGSAVDAAAAQAVIATFDRAMETVRNAQEAETMAAVFPAVYQSLLAIVPSVLALDNQAKGKTS